LRVGAYPGTFDPPTVAHLAIAEGAIAQGRLDRIDLIVSTLPLGKEPTIPTLADRIEVLEKVASTRPWLGVTVTDLRLIADIAVGYDSVVVGADKWLQMIDPAWYDTVGKRDAAIEALPAVLVVPRPPTEIPPLPPVGPGPPAGIAVLDLGDAHALVSSTAVRAGRLEWMLEEAAAFDAATGAWTDRDRYLRRGARG
jgi:Cytidylyltransferase-like